MAFDNDLMYRKASVGDLLTGTVSTAFLTHGEHTIPMDLRVVVPGNLGTNPTLDISVHESDNGSTVKEFHTMPQITVAGEYYFPIKFKRLTSKVITIVGGTATPNFGAVTIGLVPSGRHADN